MRDETMARVCGKELCDGVDCDRGIDHRNDGGVMGDDEMKYVEMLLYENGALSLTRALVVSGWLAFLGVSAYLVWRGVSWQNYETFASLTAGGGAVTQIANKFINSKYNSVLGSYRENGGDKK